MRYRITNNTQAYALLILICALIFSLVVSTTIVFAKFTDAKYEQEQAEIQEFSKVTMPEIDPEDLDNILEVEYSKKPEQFDTESVKFSARPKEIVEDPRPQEYTVQPGDSLWLIADIGYGNGAYYPYLMKVNGIEKEEVIIGQTLKFDYFDESKAETILDECFTYIRNRNVMVSDSDDVKPAKNSNVPEKEGMTYIGNYNITGYDPHCYHCCGKTNGVTASGVQAIIGQSIAAKGFTFGTQLYIEGYGTYTVHDRGGFKSNVIDIAADNHAECYKLTAYNIPVYRVN